MNNMPQPTAAPMPAAGAPNQPQAANTQSKYNNERLLVLSHPSMNLIEITINKELNKQFPKVFAFIMFVPGKEDNTKQSGRTYLMDKKEYIKFSIEELFQLSYALEEAAVTGASDFIKFADSSKFKGGAKAVKKVTVSAINNSGRIKVYINYNSSNANIATTFTKWSAIGFAKQIETIAREAQLIESRFKASGN